MTDPECDSYRDPESPRRRWPKELWVLEIGFGFIFGYLWVVRFTDLLHER